MVSNNPAHRRPGLDVPRRRVAPRLPPAVCRWCAARMVCEVCHEPISPNQKGWHNINVTTEPPAHTHMHRRGAAGLMIDP